MAPWTMERSEYIKQWKEKRRSQGLCVACGKPLDRDGIHCAECRRKTNQATKERRRWYLEHKICPRCGKNDIMGDETRCPECRADATNNALANRDKESYNKYHREWNKATYHKRKENGICTRCGKRKSTNGTTLCDICREKGREARRVRNGPSGLADRAMNGLCYFCNNPAKEGYKVCEEHYQKCVMAAEAGRKTQGAQKYIKDIKRIRYGRRMT